MHHHPFSVHEPQVTCIIRGILFCICLKMIATRYNGGAHMRSDCGGIHNGCYATRVHTIDVSWCWGGKGREWCLLRGVCVLIVIQHKDARRTEHTAKPAAVGVGVGVGAAESQGSEP